MGGHQVFSTTVAGGGIATGTPLNGKVGVPEVPLEAIACHSSPLEACAGDPAGPGGGAHPAVGPSCTDSARGHDLWSLAMDPRALIEDAVALWAVGEVPQLGVGQTFLQPAWQTPG